MLRSLVDSCVVRSVFGVIKGTRNTQHNIEFHLLNPRSQRLCSTWCIFKLKKLKFNL